MESPLLTLSCIITAALFLGVASGFTHSSVRSDEICGVQNGRKLYVDLGDRGILRSTYVNEEALLEASSKASHAQCSIEVVTCPSCVITASFKYINMSSCSPDSTCRCDYVWITEPPYENSGTPFCGTSLGSTNSLTYRSLTRIVQFAFLHSSNRRDAFEIEYRSERNKQVLGLPSPQPGSFFKPLLNLNASRGGQLTSPFFPANYPRDLGIEFIITSMDQKANVQIIFTDFQVSGSSIIEFYDWNGQRLDVTSGSSFRPAIVISTGPSMLIRFYANGGTGLGFKAHYSFISSDVSKNPLMRPNTDCGGIVDNPGGAITMMQMADEGSVKHFDCIWIIKPPRNYFHLKTHLYLKITQFSEFGGSTELVVRQGVTSEGVLVETLRSPVSEMQPPSRALREMILPVEVGFYVALRGAFSARSKLSIVYVAFSYMDCFTGADFLCKNHRCISQRLTCDGFDHCGDNSDEPTTTCMQDWSDGGLYDKRRHSNVPNYFFPKMDRYPDLRTATMVFLVSSLGLVMLIVALIVLLYRMGSRARQQRDLQNRLRTISELLADNARVEELPPDDPPTYEPPPGYDDIIKVASRQSPVAGCSNRVIETTAAVGRGPRPRGRSRNKSRRRAKSTPGISTSGMENVALRVALPRSPSSRRASTSTAWSTDDQGGSAPILMLAARNLGTTPIPDSPPPPYMAEPSMAVNFSQESLLARASRQASSVGAALVELVRPSVTQELIGAEPVLTEVISPCTTMNSIADETALESAGPSSMCKLASAETFDELCNSQENFANFDTVEEYPACGSMASSSGGSHPHSLDAVSRSTLDDVLSACVSRVHSRHPSQDTLDEPQEPVLVRVPPPPPPVLLGQQVRLLRSQIEEQNAALAQAAAAERRCQVVAGTSSGSAIDPYEDYVERNLVARFIEAIQRRESSASSASDDSQTRQFF